MIKSGVEVYLTVVYLEMRKPENWITLAVARPLEGWMDGWMDVNLLLAFTL